ncbi:hypothetical protein B0H66DRAFT_609065 [Apodospora peruviana]|uniref:Uncharacterized protein n=1 Tax=Apodospora peruviana TaxID=516989 RepID=A0AAE0LXS7_9PEZI|nr:hypothetical protein B0H66DRAFT_609065 [Apodospora peruviana]
MPVLKLADFERTLDMRTNAKPSPRRSCGASSHIFTRLLDLFHNRSVTPATALLRAVTMRNPPPPTRRPDGRGRPRKIRPRDAKKKTKWTYGGYLLQEQFEHVDMDLRRLVMRCMMDDPADRPEMEEIGAMIEAKLASEEEEDAGRGPGDA